MYEIKTINDTIQKKPYINYTFKYIIPYFTKSKSKEFYKAFWNIKWIAFGIGDYNYSDELNLYCLSQISSPYDINVLVDDNSFINEYMYDPKRTNLNMLVFNCNKTALFAQGSYSQMYNKSELSYFPDTIYRNGIEYPYSVKKVLTKDENYKQIHIQQIKDDFNVTIDIDPEEYDYPPQLANEIFNYKE